MKFYVTSQYQADNPFNLPNQGSSNNSSISRDSNKALSPEIISDMERSSAQIRTFNMSAQDVKPFK